MSDEELDALLEARRTQSIEDSVPRAKPVRKEPETVQAGYAQFGFTQPMVPLVDYVAMMENIRKQVLAEVMGEIKGEPAEKASVEDEDIRWEDMLFDDASEDEDLAELQEPEFDEEEPVDGFDEAEQVDGFDEEDGEEDDDDIEIVIDIEPEEDEDETVEISTDTEEDDDEEDDEGFDFSGLFELGDTDEEEEDTAGDEDFDIMELMRSVVEDETDDRKAEKANRMEDISELVAPGEVADVTLEELGEVVAILRKQKKKS